MKTKTPFASPVKEYSLESHVCDDEGKFVLDQKTSWKYDQNQQLFEMTQYDPKTKFKEITNYSYLEDNKLKESVVKIEDGEEKKRLIYEYQDGILSQILEIAGDYKLITKFDECGSPTEKQTYTPEGRLISTAMYVNMYDKIGNLVEKHTIFPSGESEWIDKFQYDDKGLLIEEQKSKGQIISTVRHSYNDRDDLILSEFNPDGFNNETLKREFVYNDNNDTVEIKEFRKGWCYQDHNDDFGLTGIHKYSYIR